MVCEACVACGVWPFVLSGFRSSLLVPPELSDCSSLSPPMVMLLPPLPSLPYAQMSLCVVDSFESVSAWDVQAQIPCRKGWMM